MNIIEIDKSRKKTLLDAILIESRRRALRIEKMKLYNKSFIYILCLKIKQRTEKQRSHI